MNEIDPPGNENAEENQTQPSAAAPVEPSADAPVEAPAVPAPGSKPRTSVGLFILGFLAALVLYGGLSAIMFQLYTPSGDVGGLLGSSVLIVIDFAAFLAMLLWGRTSGKVALASFGKGGVWACIAVPLLALLAFGTCWLLIPQN